MKKIERLSHAEMILPLIVLIDSTIEETEYKRVTEELQKVVTMIYTNDRTLVDLMIVDKVPAFFDAVSCQENFEPEYSAVINEIADYALWKVSRRKREYRENMVTYLLPMVLLISDFLNNDVLTLLENPEWIRNINDRGFYFILCSIDGRNINFEMYASRYEVEVFSAERIFEKYCSKIRDYDTPECGESMPTECFRTVKVKLPDPALYGLCVGTDESSNIKELPDLEDNKIHLIEIEI